MVKVRRFVFLEGRSLFHRNEFHGNTTQIKSEVIVLVDFRLKNIYINYNISLHSLHKAR